MSMIELLLFLLGLFVTGIVTLAISAVGLMDVPSVDEDTNMDASESREAAGS